MRSLEDFLEQLLPRIHDVFIQSDELHKWELFKRAFPSTFCTPGLFLECPLNGKKKWIDLSIKIDPLSSLFPQSVSCLREAFSDRNEWKKCLDYLEKTRLKTGYFGIELDIGSGKGQLPSPNLFICTEDFQKEGLSRFARGAFLAINEKQLSSQMRANIDQYVNVCASMEDEIFACGFMLARSTEGVRFHSSIHSPSNLGGLEERIRLIGYSPSVKPLIDLLKKIPPIALQKLGLSFDIGNEIGPKIGIERFGSGGQPTREEWGPLLALLVHEGMASPETVEACLNWAGGSRKKENEETYSLFVRTISHMKLTFDPQTGLTAKIYLRVIHKAIPSAPLTLDG